MNSPFEIMLQHSMRTSTEYLEPSPDLPGEVVRLGRSAQRRRRALASSGAAVVVAVAIAATVTGVGRPAGHVDPAASPSGTPTPVPSATAPPSSGTSQPAPTTPPGVVAGGVAVLDKANTIHTADGGRVRIPLPAGETANGAWRVAGGWVIRSTVRVTEPFPVRFLSDAGQLREFGFARLRGHPLAVSADGRSLAAYVHPTFYVVNLPSLAVAHQIDAVGRNGGAQMQALWLAAGRLIAQYEVLETGGTHGVITWNLDTGAETASPGVRLGDVSADGSTAVLHRTRGTGPDGVGCVRVVTREDRLSVDGDVFCAPGRSLGDLHLSPDGTWLAASVSTSGTSSAVWLYRTAQLRAGTAQPVRFDDLYPGGHVRFAGWHGDGRVLLAEERLELAASCPVAGGSCQALTLPPRPTAIVQ